MAEYQANPGDVIDLAWGNIKIQFNEIEVNSLVEDPPGVRLASSAGGSLGKISGNRLRPDGVHDEVCMIQFKIDERYRPASAGGHGTHWENVGEVRIDVRRRSRTDDPNDDKAMEPAVQYLHDGIIYHKPVTFLAGANLGPAGGGGRATRFYTDHGEFCFNMQDDGEGLPTGIVYATHHSLDESAWTAVGRLKVEPL